MRSNHGVPLTSSSGPQCRSARISITADAPEQDGERAAIEAVVHACLPQVLRAARGTGLDPQRAQDVTQSVLLTFVEGIARFEGRSHVRTWIFGILYRKLSEAWRAVRREDEWDEIDEVVEARFAPDGIWARPPRPADRETLDQEIRSHLATCLEEVPDRQRIAFLLREVERLSTAEVCSVMEVTDTNLVVDRKDRLNGDAVM